MSNHERWFIPERGMAILWSFNIFLCIQVQEILVITGPLPGWCNNFPNSLAASSFFKTILSVSLLPIRHTTSSPSWPLPFCLPPSWLLFPVVSQPSAFHPLSHKREGGGLPSLPATLRHANCPASSRAWSWGLGSKQQGTSESQEREIPPTSNLCPLRFPAGKQGRLGDVWQFPVGSWVKTLFHFLTRVI